MAWRDSAPGRIWNRGLTRARHRYYRDLAPHRHVERRSAPAPDVEAWVESLGSPSRIVVVAAGPTAGDVRPEPGWLCVATNSSDRVVAEHPYVYFLSESYPIDRYVKRGPVSTTCLGTFFRFETRGVSDAQVALARRTIAFSQKWSRAAPDVIASNVADHGVENANFEVFERRILEHLGEPVRQYNSGFGATYLGYFLAVTLGVPLDLYGLDAGVGGEKHFDGTAMSSPSVIGDRGRSKLAELYELLQAQDHVEVTNHSAFLPFGPPGTPEH